MLSRSWSAAPQLDRPSRSGLRNEKRAGCWISTHGAWGGEPLGDGDYVISADEKTSIHARSRRHASQPPKPGAAMLVEHEFTRAGALAYVAAWDVQRGKVVGRCEPTPAKFRLTERPRSPENQIRLPTSGWFDHIELAKDQAFIDAVSELPQP